jgi:competence protein ComGF
VRYQVTFSIDSEQTAERLAEQVEWVLFENNHRLESKDTAFGVVVEPE